MLGQAYFDAWRKPGQVLDMVRQVGPAYMRIQRGKKEQHFKNLEDKQTTRFQGKISNHRVVDARKFDFAEVRAIKNSVPGATINDAMLTIVGGGMRKYLESKGELPDGSLVSGCPIDVRTPAERAAGGNMVGFMNVSLRTDIRDPLERLAAVREESQSAKRYAEALGPRFVIDLTDVMPGNVLSLAIRTASATGLSEAGVVHNTIVTNVPGPPHQLYMCGAAIVDAISLGPLLPNVGLFHIVYSAVQDKKGSINLSFTGDRDMLPDPAFYADCLQASFEELRAAAAAVKKPAGRKRAAGKKRASKPSARAKKTTVKKAAAKKTAARKANGKKAAAKGKARATAARKTGPKKAASAQKAAARKQGGRARR
jgi:WS/DGAT/MGAT family acyltransferase